MIVIRNKSAVSTPISIPVGTTVIPFDTLVANTNNATAWNSANNSVIMKSAGRFNTSCTAVMSCVAGGDVTLQLFANGAAIAGDSVSASVEANGTVPLVLSVPVNVQEAEGSDSFLQWAITASAACTIENAFANIQGIR